MWNKQRTSLLFNRLSGAVIVSLLMAVVVIVLIGARNEKPQQVKTYIATLARNQSTIIVSEFNGTIRLYTITKSASKDVFLFDEVKMPPVKSSDGVTKITLPWKCNTLVLTGSSDTPSGPKISFN